MRLKPGVAWRKVRSRFIVDVYAVSLKTSRFPHRQIDLVMRKVDLHELQEIMADKPLKGAPHIYAYDPCTASILFYPTPDKAYRVTVAYAKMEYL